MKVIFRDLNPDVAQAVASVFRDVPNFDVACADIFSAGAADAIVSPANSFGMMDGGIDFVYLRRFGVSLMRRLQQQIAATGRLLPVGEAMLVSTANPAIPWMISAPTMALPGPVPETRNAYLAFLAALRLARNHGLNLILCPGLATWCGKMAPTTSAMQMREAWNASIKSA